MTNKDKITLSLDIADIVILIMTLTKTVTRVVGTMNRLTFKDAETAE